MKTKSFRHALTIAQCVLLAALLGSCRFQDAIEPLTCEYITKRLTACTNGWKLTSTKENGVVSAAIAPYSRCSGLSPEPASVTTQITFTATAVGTQTGLKAATERCFCPSCGSYNGDWTCNLENGKIQITYRRYIKFGLVTWTKEVKKLTNSTLVLGFTQDGVQVEETYACQ